MTDLWRPETCWRTTRANRVAWLIDTQAYFTALYETLLRARRSVAILGWGFDPRTRLAPDGGVDPGEPDEIGRVLLRLVDRRPDLDVRLLIWKSALPISATQDFFPHRAHGWFKGTKVKFQLDNAVPFGACHHQKLAVVDDAVAFVGGGDIGTDRWDSVAHRDVDSRRMDPDHICHSPRHEVMIMVDGEAAAALGQLARDRWLRATGEVLEPPIGLPTEDPWPGYLRPDMTEVETAIARTLPAWRGDPEISEIRELTLASIREARDLIYLENQYFTSPAIAEALAARLLEPDGPEVVLISTRQAPSWFDRLTMDRVRDVTIRRLKEADVFGRFRAYSPSTPGGMPIIVHSKVTVIDDDVARVGSANLNNRSGGFDTELEVGAQARTDDQREAIAHLRSRLVGHFVSRDAESIARAMGEQKSLIRAIEALNRKGRLTPLDPKPLGPLARLIADFHLGDPTAPQDSLRPWRRRRLLNSQVRDIAAEGGMVRFIRSVRNRLPGGGGPTPPG